MSTGDTSFEPESKRQKTSIESEIDDKIDQLIEKATKPKKVRSQKSIKVYEPKSDKSA